MPPDAAANWETFVALWERAHAIRSFIWDHPASGERNLLGHFLVRLRRFFAVDFCFGALAREGEREVVEIGIPKTGINRLPADFSRRCLDLLASGCAPIVWNEAGDKFGFRSTILAPMSSSSARPFGFVMLGHSLRKSYSVHELFLLRALAGDLSRVVRELYAGQQRQHQTLEICHDLKNSLQLILGNVAVLRQSLGEARAEQEERSLHAMERAVDEILRAVNRLLAEPPRDGGVACSRKNGARRSDELKNLSKL